jgi:hypothetical protein
MDLMHLGVICYRGIDMRTLFALAAAAALAGCGDDSASGADLGTPALDMAASGAACAAYCDAVQGACAASSDGGALTQYMSGSDCLDYCDNAAAWPAGASGNTLGCRLAQATAAATGSDVAAHCAAAGPSGDNVCGSWCDNFCQLMLKNCTGANAIYDAATCMTKCASMPATGKPGDVTGNTVQCRIYHMGVAFHDPVTHCPHGRTLADNPSGPCQ